MRKKTFSLLLASALLPPLFGAGCASSARISKFDAFAAAGTQYTQVVGALLDEARIVAIDSNSQRLLDSRELAPVGRASLEEQDAALRELAGELQLLRFQTGLLDTYFRGLGRLAAKGVPDAFAQELGNTALALDAVSTALREKKLVSDEEYARDAATVLGRLVMRGVQGRALRQELESRKETIATILGLQERLLAALEAQMKADLQYTVSRRYEQSVAAPFLDGNRLASEPEQMAWMVERRALLTQVLTARQLQAAAGAARNLRAAWEKVLREELSVADVASVTNELVPILENLNYVRQVAGAGGSWSGGGSSWDSGGGSWGDDWGGVIGVSYWNSRWNVSGQPAGAAGGWGGSGASTGNSGGGWGGGSASGSAPQPGQPQPPADGTTTEDGKGGEGR